MDLLTFVTDIELVYAGLVQKMSMEPSANELGANKSVGELEGINEVQPNSKESPYF